ncbi:MAG: nucleotidyltransferase family protein [Burkholderiales bacterium]|nr:nucleotidyltransferase family protein [Burkholderiales bacterium]
MPVTTLSLLCALLRGEAPAWPADAGSAAVDDFLREARYHGVTPLLDARWRAQRSRSVPRRAQPTGGADPPAPHATAPPLRAGSAAAAPGASWPETIWRTCREDALVQALFERAHRDELGRVLARFAQGGITPLIMKGSALAYTHYATPVERPRGDTDLLVAESHVRATGALLAGLGYTRGHGVSGELISYEADWSRAAGAGFVHHLDVHWRVNNSQILARLLTYDELAPRAVPVPALGPHARTPCAVHALLFACMHRTGHANAPYFVDGRAYLGGDRLIWLYDMHLLVARMSDAEVAEFVALARAKRLRAICRDALALCAARFATPLPPPILAGLAPDGNIEPSARYLAGGRTRQMLGDFLALDGAAERVRWLQELAFPSAEYMRRQYPDSERRWLPVLYARRGLHGLWRLVAGTRDDRPR